MFQKVLRAARPAILSARSSLRPSTSKLRAFSTTLHVQSGGPPPPKLYGDGGKAGSVPTDYEQATGLERLELLGDMEGIKVFDDAPLDSSRIGTKKDPVLVPSYDVERIIGCTGVPADSHDVLWFNLYKDKLGRCTECGSVYALNFLGEEHSEEHGEEHAEEHHH